jgi:hypothetical protein
MRDAEVNGEPVTAGPDTPDEAICPACGTEVHKRKRTCMGRTVTYFYRHRRGQAKDCPRRYRIKRSS